MDGMNHNIAKVSKGKQYGNYISLLPLTEEVTGVTLYGFKYPLTDKTLVIGDSLGVSNELIEDEGIIVITSGTLIVVESMD
jgi:thiamine pyrophosphokinase